MCLCLCVCVRVSVCVCVFVSLLDSVCGGVCVRRKQNFTKTLYSSTNLVLLGVGYILVLMLIETPPRTTPKQVLAG